MTYLEVQLLSIGNFKAYHMSYAIMLQVYYDYYVLTAISTTYVFSHYALSPCISAWTIPTYPFIYFGNIDLTTCRFVDLSTCRPVDLVLLSITKIRLGLGCGLGLGLVWG